MCGDVWRCVEMYGVVWSCTQLRGELRRVVYCSRTLISGYRKPLKHALSPLFITVLGGV